MIIHLIQGEFSGKDAITIITKMIDVKIKFQAEKIKTCENGKEIKKRENLIKTLQKELFESRKLIEAHGDRVCIESEINLS